MTGEGYVIIEFGLEALVKDDWPSRHLLQNSKRCVLVLKLTQEKGCVPRVADYGTLHNEEKCIGY